MNKYLLKRFQFLLIITRNRSQCGTNQEEEGLKNTIFCRIINWWAAGYSRTTSVLSNLILMGADCISFKSGTRWCRRLEV